VLSRRLLRFVTTMLLVWIAVDLAAIDTCALPAGHCRALTRTSVSSPASGGVPAHSYAALHPDHCFCRGVSTGADLTAAVIDPAAVGHSVADAPSDHPSRISAALYHPPRAAA
jgi:hypothetical protein